MNIVATPPQTPPSSATSPTKHTHTACFPTSSRLMTADRNLSPANRDSAPLDDAYRSLGSVPTCETNTLAVPLMLAHILWWSSPCRKHSRLRRLNRDAPDPFVDYECGTSGAKSCSHRQSAKSCPSTTSKFSKIGSAFEQCFFELRFFLSWDPCNLCISVDEHYQSRVDKKLREFRYYEDAFGRYQQSSVPKYSAFTTCEHGHQSPTNSVDVPIPKKCSSHPASKKLLHPTAKSTSAPAVSGTCSTSAKSTVSPTAQQTMSAAATSTAPAAKLAATASSSSGSSPTPAATVPTAAAKTTPSATTQTAAAKPKADSARRQQKKPEQVQSSALLSDCRCFPGFAESNAEKRTYMSRDATLAEVMRGLNRAVLAFGVASGDTLVYTELAGMVALLNYAAALYIDFADGIESYMQHRFGNLFVDHYFRTVYCNRASYIEKEEFNSEGSPASKNDPEARKTRRHAIQTSFTKMVPDVTELRDGVQTVLFTFTWINYSAYKGYDAAMTATLHNVIPLLETIIVRCARQMYLMQRALTAAKSISVINTVQAPKAYDLQWDLLDLSAALQNLSGGDLALFTSDCYERGDENSRKQRGKKHGTSWNEKVVSCPYSAHLYTSAVADITLRTLLQMRKAIHSGTFSKPPVNHEVKCNDHCNCSHCATFGDTIAPIIDGLYKRLTLIERKQYDWKPLMVKRKKVKKAKRKSDAAGASASAIKGQGPKIKRDDEEKEMMLRDILSKRIDEFDTPNTMLKGPSDYAYFTDPPLLSKKSKSSSAANKIGGATMQTTTSTSAVNVVTTTKTVKSGSATITARTSDTGGSVSLSIASSALPESIQQKLLDELRKKPSSFSGSQAEWTATMAGPFASTTEPDFTKNPAYQAFRMALGEVPVSADVPSCLTEAEREAWLEGSFEGLFEAMSGPPGLEEDYHSWAMGSGLDGVDD